MPGNRKAFETFVFEFMGSLTKGGGNRKIYERLFSQMNDKQMDMFVDKLEQGMPLSVWASNFEKAEMFNYEGLLKICDKYGLPMEQQLVVYDQDTGIKSLTPIKYVVGTAEIRKQRQMQVKKFGVSKDDSKVEDLTGQVMGESRAAGLSIPEVQVLDNLGLPTLANELYNVKGGDLDALKVFRNELITTGKATTNAALKQGTGAKVLKTAHFILLGRHIQSNIHERD
ncbi:hypothetical protein RISINGSUN_220 [Erwinia phage vB_EamM_RisingSun]|uniref:Virion structural protein n=2 Tax=Risingsunvirus risingsun TaxID=2560435 RepID=A0A223LHJ7_9CAUD|nr:RNA polymerase beta subunit [Erwinia phage vB_EamM_RisingSun]ASU03450.1 hypothetical protein RISINGSUN_220 [Erwinia phage vB_EamM_RisingSun]ASU03693.1 hypothetical protein JOAD_222 [Erwinia phage vB_EamM_Joad]